MIDTEKFEDGDIIEVLYEYPMSHPVYPGTEHKLLGVIARVIPHKIMVQHDDPYLPQKIIGVDKSRVLRHWKLMGEQK
jgi:hypothetical protein